MDLVLDGLLLLVAHVIELDDVIAGRCAQRLTHLSWLELHDEIGQEGRQLTALAPSQGATLERGLAVGIGHRQLREVFTALGALVDVLSLLPGLVGLLRRGGFAYGDEDVGDVVLVMLVGRLGLLVQVLVDFARGDADALEHVALTKNAEHELPAHLVAVGGVVDALLRQDLRQLGKGDVIALSHLL